LIQVFEGVTANDVWCAAASFFRNNKSVPTHVGRGGTTRELLRAGFLINDPRQRWVVGRDPPINPAFSLAEVVWIINGRNESSFLNYWNTQLPRYAGNSEIYHGAYGYRFRYQFKIDQLTRAFQALKNNPDSRQVVLQIWDARADIPSEDGSPVDPDVPCNIVSLLLVRDTKLEWTQIMRSNDLFLGTPHNFIQFTSLQEILAGWLEINLGSYYHLSNSLHVYQDRTGSDLQISNVDVAPNTDSLAIPKEESDVVFTILYSDIQKMMSSDLSPDQLLHISIDTDVPKAYKNILLVIASEAARRRGWIDLSKSLMENCSNPIFIQTWERWCDRMSIKK